MKNKLKRIAAGILVCCLLSGTFPISVFAESGPVALVWGLDEDQQKGKTYTSVKDAWEAAREKGNIKMLTDWQIGTALDVKSDETVYLHMDGKMIDRNKTNKDADISDSGGNGSVIRVGKRATLYIIGGSDTTVHNGYIENDIWFASESVPENKTAYAINGGLITGGGSDSDYGGGITVDGFGTLTCNNVTFAGNIADEYFGVNGNGGAIKMKGDQPLVTLKNCRICYNKAVGYGGGIIAEAENAYISLTNTSIDHNTADLGGGIYIDNVYGTVWSDETSVISENSADDGGGIYIDDESALITGATIKNNKAKKGGGIYICDDFATLEDTIVTGNKASSHGGGIYLDVYGDTLNIGNDSTFRDLTVTGNTASKKGGGIYVETEWEDISFSAKVIIKDNKGSEEKYNNMFFDGVPDETDVVVVSNPGRESHICMGVENSAVTWYFTGNGAFNDSFFHADNPDCHIEFDFDKCKLVFKQGEKAAKANIIEISDKDFAAKPVNLEYTAGEEKWPVLRGFFSLTESGDGHSNDTVSFYYSDGYFFNDPYKYDTHLASTSMSLVKASGTSKNGGKDDYTNKFSDIRQLLYNMGFDDSKTRVNDEYMKKMSSNSIGVIFSQKKLYNSDGSDSGRILLPVVVRSSGYEKEWAGNFNVGAEGEHLGFSIAAETVVKELDAYMEETGLTELAAQGRICFWITGFSRGGATANLVSKRMIERYWGSGNKIFSYTFAAPQGGVQSSQKLEDKSYYNIHNTVNISDFVPYVAPVEMGFKRYGVDHYVPGSAIGEVTEKKWYYQPDGTNIKKSDAKYYADNVGYSASRTESGPLTQSSADTYGKQRELMLKQFLAVAGGDGFSDYFHIGTLDRFSFMNRFYKKVGDADVSVDQWLQDLLHYIQVWGMNHVSDTRAYLASEIIANDMTLSESIGNLMDIMMDSPELLGDIKGNLFSQDITGWLITVSNGLPAVFDVLTECLDTFEEGYPSDSELSGMIDDLWEAMIDSDLLEHCNEEEKVLIKENLDVVLFVVLRFVNYDYGTSEDSYRDGMVNSYNTNYNNRDGEYEWCIMTGTLINNLSFLQNHHTRVYEAWIRSYDSYFTEYEINTYGGGTGYAPRYVSLPDKTIDAPVLEGVVNKGVYDNSTSVTFRLPDHLLGGSIFYYITTVVDGTRSELQGPFLYTEPVDFGTVDGKTTEYILAYYSASYGVKCVEQSVEFTVRPGMMTGSIINNGNAGMLLLMTAVFVAAGAGAVIWKKRKKTR